MKTFSNYGLNTIQAVRFKIMLISRDVMSVSDLRFGRSETNIWMVQTFAFGSGHNIACTFTCVLIEYSLERTLKIKSY